MPEHSWKESPTPGAQVLARALEDNPSWSQQALAHAAGMDPTKVNRWIRGRNNPSEVQVAEVARTLGYDPRDFGITDPRALAADFTSPEPPAWFAQFVEQQQAAWQTINDKLDALLAQ